MEIIVTQGEQAVENGQILQEEVLKYFKSKNIDLEMEFSIGIRKKSGFNVKLFESVPYNDIYDEVKKTPYYLVVGNKSYRIEIHGQKTSGTTDEKVPYWVRNAQYVPEEVILILDGDGFTSAKKWAKKELLNNKKISIFENINSATEFIDSLIAPYAIN